MIEKSSKSRQERYTSCWYAWLLCLRCILTTAATLRLSNAGMGSFATYRRNAAEQAVMGFLWGKLQESNKNHQRGILCILKSMAVILYPKRFLGSIKNTIDINVIVR